MTAKQWAPLAPLIRKAVRASAVTADSLLQLDELALYLRKRERDVATWARENGLVRRLPGLDVECVLWADVLALLSKPAAQSAPQRPQRPTMPKTDLTVLRRAGGR